MNASTPLTEVPAMLRELRQHNLPSRVQVSLAVIHDLTPAFRSKTQHDCYEAALMTVTEYLKGNEWSAEDKS